jgi:HEAT repeat protein
VEALSPEILDDLRHGRAPRERKIAVSSTGGAHIAPAERVEILVVLSHDPDELVSSRAGEALLSCAPEHFVESLKRENAMPALFTYAEKNLVNTPGALEAMLGNKNCSGEHLVPLVSHFSAAQVQALMEELDRISASHLLAAALEHSPHITADQKNTLHELQSTVVSDDLKHLADAAAEAEPDPQRRQTLLQQISRMTVSQRVQFAMKGGSDARRTLIRDSNKVVQRAVLQSPRLTDQEVESFASMANLTDEILRLIAGNRVFRKNYVVVRNLMNNAKTPLDVSLHMLPMLNPLDLKRLGMN